ncbi:MAG: Ig-like domain-containing protein [Thermoanaerobaculia bacterium]
MHRSFLQRCLLFSAAMVLATQPAVAGGDLGDLGSVQRWEKLEVDLAGPSSVGLSETANPFLLEVTATFSGPGGTFAVPAFYAGDGAGGLDGDIWRARFAANAIGDWTLSTSSTDPLLDGYSAIFQVTDTVACEPLEPGELPDFACTGRLLYAEDYYLQFADGTFWLKGGVDDPEDFLAPGQTAGFATKQEAIQYLADERLNSLYFMTHNTGGDRDNVWPWVTKRDSEHFDVAKLDGWDLILDDLQAHGIMLHLVLENDSGWTGFNRDLYYRQIVARFGHYNGLIWNLSEEYGENYTPDQIKTFAQMLTDLDPYDHPLTVHDRGPTLRWNPFYGDDRFDLTSFHTYGSPQNDEAISARQLSATAGRPIAISFDETGDITPAQDDNRHLVWSIYVGGGNYEIHTRPLTDYRDWQAYFRDLVRARTFFEALPFWEMLPSNQLLLSGTGYILSKTGEVYVCYLPGGGSLELDLGSNTNVFDASWFNPRTGESTDIGAVTGGGVSPFDAPDTLDWTLLLLLQGSGPNVAPVALNQNLETPANIALSFALSFDDPDGPGPYSFTVEQEPAFGELSEIDSIGVVTFTPDTDFNGFDEFWWSVSDSEDPSNTAIASIRVGNRPPEAFDQLIVTAVGVPVLVHLPASDIDEDPLTYSVVDPPVSGTISSDDGDNAVLYSPNDGFEGDDTFTFLAEDLVSQSNEATVTIRVRQPEVFADSFESGNTSAWSQVVE